VKFYANGQWLGTANKAPYRWTWDTRSLSDGWHVIQVQAVNLMDQSVTVNRAIQVVNGSAAVNLEGGNAVAFTHLNDVRVYPNPWRSDRHSTLPIRFDQLTDGCTVKIFSVDGHWVKTLTADSNGAVSWDRTNNAGQIVASGNYLYVATDTRDNKARGQIVLIQ
jgi:flagellar hook assembly protein FlgD